MKVIFFIIIFITSKINNQFGGFNQVLNDVPIKYKVYDKEKTVIRKNIKFDKDIAEKINYAISLFNQENKIMKINNDVIINVGMKEFLSNVNMDKLKDLVVNYDEGI